MKIATQMVNPILNVDSPVQEFTIKNTGHAFRILSDGLYSDKITAVIREIGCNAADAHVEVGKSDLPFKVHLPTRFDHRFSIRDFGPGLSPEDVRRYVTYFDSNKTDTNDATGCLGLGSKSPFAYTDSFSVTSYWKGRKYVFVAFISDDYIPSIVSLQDHDSEEPSGVEVSFATREEDIDDFLTKARRVFSVFDVLPECNRPLAKKIYKFSFESNADSEFKWGLMGADHAGENLLIQGNVAYPISVDVLNSLGSSLTFTGSYYSKDRVTVIIFADIGSVDITPSRESLSVTYRTKEYLTKVLKDVDATIERGVAQQITPDTDILEVMKFQRSMPWKQFATFTKGDAILSQGHLYFDNSKGNILSVVFKPGKVPKKCYTLTQIPPAIPPNYLVDCPWESLYFVIKDTKRGKTLSSIWEHCKPGQYNAKIVIVKNAAAVAEYQFTDQERIFLMSDINRQQRKNRAPGPKQFRFDSSEYARCSVLHAEIDDDAFDQGGIYFERENRTTTILRSRGLFAEDYKNVALTSSIARMLNRGSLKHFVVNKRDCPKFKESTQWVLFEDWWELYLEQFILTQGYFVALFEIVGNEYTLYSKFPQFNPDGLVASNSFKDMVDRLDRMRYDKRNMPDKYKAIIRTHQEKIDAALNRYPLLNRDLQSRWNRFFDTEAKLAEYLNLVDYATNMQHLTKEK